MRDYVDAKKLLNVVKEGDEGDEGDEDDESDEGEFSFGPNSFRNACTVRHFLYEFLMVISARGATAVAAIGALPSSRSWHIRFSGCARHFSSRVSDGKNQDESLESFLKPSLRSGCIGSVEDLPCRTSGRVAVISVIF